PQATQSITVTPKAAAVAPNAASKTYGAADPALTGTLSGFLAADNVTATYSRTAGETVTGGPYTISATLSPAGVLVNYAITYNTATLGPAAVLSNYTITNAGASFTINARAATWATTSNSKTYGDPDPTPLTTGSGTFLAADGVTASYSRAAGETVGGGPYHITATLAPAGVLSNYTITNKGADFTINAR